MRDTLMACLKFEKEKPDPVSREARWLLEAMKEVRDGDRQT